MAFPAPFDAVPADLGYRDRMTKIDWTSLSPHRPVDRNVSLYEPRLEKGGAEIARWITAGRRSVLVVGPVGVGKSTELAQAARRLQDQAVACLVRLDRHSNVRSLTGEAVLLHLAGQLVDLGVRVLGLDLPSDLIRALRDRGILDRSFKVEAVPYQLQGSAEVIVRYAIDSIRRSARQDKVVFLVDGLEKAPEEVASNCLSALSHIATLASVVAVAPWHVAYGPGAAEAISGSEQLVSIPAVDTAGLQGRELLYRMAERRLPEGVSFESIEAVVSGAAVWSGGIPRTLFQLIADAGMYAEFQSKKLPDMADLALAVKDHKDSMIRLLLPGDIEAMGRARKTMGVELELSRKIRLLSHGVLLEQPRSGGTVLEVHPLLYEVVS